MFDFKTSKEFVLIVDYYNGGDLTKYIEVMKDSLNPSILEKIIYEISIGIYSLQKAKEDIIGHRDLKSDNIFLAVKSSYS